MKKTNLRRNNLDRSNSPYLRQHRDNPVWWQEWGSEILLEAVRQNKPLFVSVGYSTCHWCHVMAAEAFSDPATAEFFNKNFISIKVDRETRPDIDQYLMHFIQAQSNSGGWPLNVFLTPDLRPAFALTYAPASADSQRGMQPLLVIAEKVLEYINAHGAEIEPFHFSAETPAAARPDTLIAELLTGHDPLYGGFGMGQKFPPHSTLLYMLYYLSIEKHPELEKVCRLTLDSMRRGGLHDHLQGGIFRYCVNRQWTIPHFEKMLYDQAMALWVYALAFRVLGDEAYKEMALGIVRCLQETFAMDGLFATAFDADTDHHEGSTYVWQIAEIREMLSEEEFTAFAASYRLPQKGNFENAIHLTRSDDRPLKSIEAKLLARRRPQPERDEKVLCGVNALAACALVQAGRWLGRPELECAGAQTVKKLIDVFWDGKRLAHSLADGKVQQESFLSDAAALLLAVTLVRESNEEWADNMNALVAYTNGFREQGQWLESNIVDFKPVVASVFDHPVPSAVSLAVMGLARAAVLNGQAVESLEYLRPLQSDFFNIAVMIGQGLFHQVHSKAPIAWERLPANAIQMRGEPETDCFKGQCRPLTF